MLRWLLILTLLPLFVSPNAGQSDEAVQDRQVWAFYLSFWAGPHTWPLDILADTPEAGLYNSKLPGIASTHIAQAQAAGIDAFVVNWWGEAETVTTTPALINLLDRAHEQDFQIGAVVDMFPEEFYPDQASVERSIQWLLDVAVPHPAYLHYQGKPVIVFAFQDRPGFDAAYWQELRQRLDPERQTWWISEGLSACCLYDGAMDGMYAFNMAWANGNGNRYLVERDIVFERGGDLYIPSVSPGWDEDVIADLTNRPNPTSPRARDGGAFLADAWDGALQAESDIIMIVSWNEFIENSHIEPSEVYGTQSLDTLHLLISGWKGPQTLSETLIYTDNIAFNLITEYAVGIRSGPGRDAPVIAYTTPQTAYQIVDEEGGFYAIALPGGSIGWLHYTEIRIRTDD